MRILRFAALAAVASAGIFSSSLGWAVVLAGDDVRACGQRTTVERFDPGVIVTTIRTHCILTT